MTVELPAVDTSPLSLYANEKPSTGGNRMVVYIDTRSPQGIAPVGAEYALFIYRDSWTLRKHFTPGLYTVEIATGELQQVKDGDKQDIAISFDSSLIQGVITRCWSPLDSTNPRISVAPASLAGEVRRLLYKNGFDEIIALASPVIQKARSEAKARGESEPDKLDPHLIYARGYAAWRTGYFAMAEQDFAAIGDFMPSYLANTWFKTASEYVELIRKMKTLAPPLVHDIKQGETVIFRVYYTQADEWTEAIVDMLSDAYAINRDMLSKDSLETSVFIFSDYDKFSEFYKLRGNGIGPSSWIWAFGGMGALYFCNDSAKTNPQARDVNSDYFQSSVVHEYNHCIVGRLTSEASMPRWLTEGLASIAEGKYSTSHVQAYADYMRLALAENAVLSSDALSQGESFTSHQEVALKKRAENQTAAEPYVQSYWMASYFLTLLPEHGLEPFLRDVPNHRSFAQVFKKHTGLTEEEFHQQWLQQLPESIR